jgi:hypothetical protein
MNEDVIETIESDGVTIKIYQDFNPANPRDWDNLGTMVCFHRRNNYGDVNETHDLGIYDVDDLKEYLKNNPCVVLNIRAYEHSGISLTADPLKSITYPYNDSRDSGWLGVILVTYETIKKEYGWKYITSARAKQIQGYLKNEVDTYNQYLNGDVYGYEVVCNICEEELDSCWGFYGSDHEKSGLLEYAKGHQCESCATISARLDAILES